MTPCIASASFLRPWQLYTGEAKTASFSAFSRWAIFSARTKHSTCVQSRTQRLFPAGQRPEAAQAAVGAEHERFVNEGFITQWEETSLGSARTNRFVLWEFDASKVASLDCHGNTDREGTQPDFGHTLVPAGLD